MAERQLSNPAHPSVSPEPETPSLRSSINIATLNAFYQNGLGTGRRAGLTEALDALEQVSREHRVLDPSTAAVLAALAERLRRLRHW